MGYPLNLLLQSLDHSKINVRLPWGDDASRLKRLQEFPTIVRIEIAKRIPELIQLSKAAEGKVAADAEAVADSIEQAIAEQVGA